MIPSMEWRVLWSISLDGFTRYRHTERETGCMVEDSQLKYVSSDVE